MVAGPGGEASEGSARMQRMERIKRMVMWVCLMMGELGGAQIPEDSINSFPHILPKISPISSISRIPMNLWEQMPAIGFRRFGRTQRMKRMMKWVCLVVELLEPIAGSMDDSHPAHRRGAYPLSHRRLF
jgi:hypothetical protein